MRSKRIPPYYLFVAYFDVRYVCINEYENYNVKYVFCIENKAIKRGDPVHETKRNSRGWKKYKTRQPDQILWRFLKLSG